jgi:hypothetical protein
MPQLKRNARLQQTESEVFSLSDSVVNDTMAEVVKHICRLQREPSKADFSLPLRVL